MNPEPTHSDRDPTTQPASLIWPQKADTGAWWEEEDRQEYIQQHFSITHISKYFRTRSPVSAADIDGWRARELMALLWGMMHQEKVLHVDMRFSHVNMRKSHVNMRFFPKIHVRKKISC